MTDVLVRLNEGVGELVLNRPKQRNSLTGPLVQELTQGLKSLLADPSCKAIVVSGAEGFFCAGLDLKAFTVDPPPPWKSEFQDLWAHYHQTLYAADVPIIGAVQGFAIAGGSSLALACDFLVMGNSAFMHVSEVERNMLAPLNVFWLTQRHSYQTALRLGLLGERWSAPELLAAGVIERCEDDTQVLSSALAMATRFASFDSKNVRALKRSIRSGSNRTHQQASFTDALAEIKKAAMGELLAN